MEGVLRHRGVRGVRGKSQIKERPSVGGACREREKTVVAASISAAPSCLRQPVQTRCKGGSVEVVHDMIVGETVRGGKGGNGGHSVHFIADTAMEEMRGVQYERGHEEARKEGGLRPGGEAAEAVGVWGRQWRVLNWFKPSQSIQIRSNSF
jgi:hypothetical protein